MSPIFRASAFTAAMGIAALLFSLSGKAADETAARELARANNCFKCHAITKDKDGPAYQQGRRRISRAKPMPKRS